MFLLNDLVELFVVVGSGGDKHVISLAYLNCLFTCKARNIQVSLSFTWKPGSLLSCSVPMVGAPSVK